MTWARRRRLTVSPSTVEVNLRAIPILPESGWRLYTIEEWPLIGAAPKGYLAYGDPEKPDCVAYIAKKGRLSVGGSRECVTEEIISKIGAMLPVRMARSQLVRLPVPRGHQPDVRFLSRNFVRRGEEELVHGIEIVAQYLNASREEITSVFNLDDPSEEQNFYTIPNMIDVLKWFCRGKGEQEVLDAFARMLAFDAFIGAPDRHALNWGVVESVSDPTSRTFAPLFDTARGLFREHTDQKLTAIAAAGDQARYIREYAERSKPVFGVQSPLRAGARCNHFELVSSALLEFPKELGRTMARFIDAVQLPCLETAIQRGFRRLITPLRMSFILGLLRHRHAKLKLAVRVMKE